METCFDPESVHRKSQPMDKFRASRADNPVFVHGNQSCKGDQRCVLPGKCPWQRGGQPVEAAIAGICPWIGALVPAFYGQSPGEWRPQGNPRGWKACSRRPENKFGLTPRWKISLSMDRFRARSAETRHSMDIIRGEEQQITNQAVLAGMLHPVFVHTKYWGGR